MSAQGSHALDVMGGPLAASSAPHLRQLRRGHHPPLFDVDSVLRALGVYAIVFGLLVFFVAFVFRRDMGKGSAALPQPRGRSRAALHHAEQRAEDPETQLDHHRSCQVQHEARVIRRSVRSRSSPMAMRLGGDPPGTPTATDEAQVSMRRRPVGKRLWRESPRFPMPASRPVPTGSIIAVVAVLLIQSETAHVTTPTPGEHATRCARRPAPTQARVAASRCASRPRPGHSRRAGRLPPPVPSVRAPGPSPGRDGGLPAPGKAGDH